MRPIREGDRGAAVEDVQRRLISLGTDLGPSGVDGVFLGATCAAVRAFQRDRGLPVDGAVDAATWAALVDATFALGDRLLYLRYPYLHGADVRMIQTALNALGFACGAVDAIFGTFTEGALRDFQANTGLAADGIAGPDTVRALDGLRHVWSDKVGLPPAELQAAPARRASVLRDFDVFFLHDAVTAGVAERLVNLAHASEPDARVGAGSEVPKMTTGLVIDLARSGAGTGTRTVAVREGGNPLSRRIAAAVASSGRPDVRIAVLVDDSSRDEHAMQALAVSLLDGVCLGLAGFARPVLQ